VRSIVIPHPVGNTGSVKVLPQHQTASLLEPQLLLELQRTHGSDRFEVMVKARNAHAKLSCNAFNPDRLVKVFAKSIDGFGDVVGVATQNSNLTQPSTLLSQEEAINDFPLNQGCENMCFRRGIY
jgi:hypothetical protein